MESKNISVALPVGTTLTDGSTTYTIESVLGKGGFGITYKVSTVMTMGNLKVKVLLAVKEHFVSSLSGRSDTGIVESSKPVRQQVEGSLKDFLSEARRLISLNGKSRSIVCVNSTFTANNTAYYTMEFIDGPSLQETINMRGALPESEALELIKSIAEAVATVHDAKMTHLDIKPGNILLATEDGGKVRPVLIDFGLAKHYDEHGHATSTLNTVGCSEGYAPIEQYGGLNTFSPTADVYALGATLYAMLTGERPPTASDVNLDELDRNMRARGVSDNTRRLVLKAMEFRHVNRFPSAKDFLTAMSATPKPEDLVDPAEEHTQIFGTSNTETEDTKIARPVTPPTPPPCHEPETEPETEPEHEPEKSHSSRTWLWIVGGCLIITAIIIGVGYTIMTKEEEETINIKDPVYNPELNDVKTLSSSYSQKEVLYEPAQAATDTTVYVGYNDYEYPQTPAAAAPTFAPPSWNNAYGDLTEYYTTDYGTIVARYESGWVEYDTYGNEIEYGFYD